MDGHFCTGSPADFADSYRSPGISRHNVLLLGRIPLGLGSPSVEAVVSCFDSLFSSAVDNRQMLLVFFLSSAFLAAHAYWAGIFTHLAVLHTLPLSLTLALTRDYPLLSFFSYDWLFSPYDQLFCSCGWLFPACSWLFNMSARFSSMLKLNNCEVFYFNEIILWIRNNLA